MKLLDRAAVSYQLVLTKTDELKPAELAASRWRRVEPNRANTARRIPRFRDIGASRATGLPEFRAELAALADN